ncbi:hypothetical protein [Mucilaginibacter arboris]|uniref:Uncharacterized protein n=1 Tax=Mucilaginibacter arboris TaxID=2682090 RepID=A0A7K1SW69_9SPHI|nr:hypothetical protein [Mucilaginibacter arboris]MVN21544.1 hypothetical protein [Mucilaginibacter arboris]
MNSKISDKIINQTTQNLPDGTVVPLTFHYPANFKIDDVISVTAPRESMQLFVPQHQEGCYAFDIEVWDDRIRLLCDSIKERETQPDGSTVFSFKIREINLFANSFPAVQKVAVYQ